MSGQLEVHGRIENWQRIKALLFSENSSDRDSDREDEGGDWGSDWGWKDEDVSSKESSKATTSSTSSDDWIRNCVMASSPMAELFVLAKGRRAVFFSSNFSYPFSVTRIAVLVVKRCFILQVNGISKIMKCGIPNLTKVSCHRKMKYVNREEITCAICIPLVSKKKTSPGAPDWTCVILGFSNGEVRMYTENGSLLINQMFHNQPVKAIKCRSYQPAPTAMKHDQLEEIFVLYHTVLVTMDGFGLFQTLRGCRNHIARLQANAAEQVVDPPPLSYKKWEYEECKVADCDSIGLETPNTFDHMLTASVIGGQSAKCSKSPITSNVFIACGERPYAAFLYAQEGTSEPLISEIAFAVASRLKNSFLNMAGGMLGFGSTPAKPTAQVAKPKPKIEPATQMQSRFGLPDKQRKGRTVTSSPCRKLSAITDSLGRVIVIDNDLGIAVRIFKGYREAQCAWLEVSDDMNSRTRALGRKALFLVIYAPRRGFLEVFSMQQGPKVAGFPVSKNGRLLSTTYGMMGLNNIPIKGGNKPTLPCVFIDHDAQIHTFNIPFHLALCDNGNSKVKDMHLLKSLQRLLREEDYDAKNVMELLCEIKTQAMINQGFKLLVQKCKKLDVLTTLVDEYLKKYCDDGDRDLSLVFRIQTLVDLYTSLVRSMDRPPCYEAGSSSPDTVQTVLKCMHATNKEMKSLQDMADRADADKKLISKTVSFKEPNSALSINEFFSCLLLEFEPSKTRTSSSSGTANSVKLNLKSENISNLGKLLFCGCLNNNSDLKEWKSHVKNADLIPSELLSLCLNFWCENALASTSYVNVMETMYHVVRALSELQGKELVFSNHSHVSSWWEGIRKKIAGCPQIFHIYSFSMVCRAVAVDIQQEVELEKLKTGRDDEKMKNLKQAEAESNSEEQEHDQKPTSSSSNMDITASDGDDEEWENVSLELIRWNILVKQIEDLSLLTMVISRRPKLEEPVLPVLFVEIQNLSVSDLLDKGKGCIAELVGKWLTSIGIDPVLLVDESEIISEEYVPSPEIGDKKVKKARKGSEEKYLVQDDMPNEPSVEGLHADKEIASVLDLLRVLKENFSLSLSSSIILSNYCWEYCLEWNKDPDQTEHFSSAVSCSSVIPCPFTKHGMMYMMWGTFIKKRLAAIASSGRIVKEKLVEKVSGFSTVELKEKFLKASVDFLEDYMSTTVFCEGLGPPPTTPSKKTHWATDASSASLTDLALMQPHSNYEMILLHYQLALTAHFIHAFNIKKSSMKPMNLFDTKVSRAQT
ncbi:Rab3 GTPase-activating protein non-catalytic subunit [Orchesella cincta]|uniref:Rab3 GTPase-activating protein non-catalytic subunit n=1 Tax=Orchesella cincta TaxID=48709 RepID=A0A1D2NAQ8_ORCCI|nr:Rab3 GTPase-activating protein non-catalytic subunit [Orchesella cincta]